MAEKITISAPFSQESRLLGRIGRVGENLSRQIVFDCTRALTDRPNATIVCVIQRPGDKQPYAGQLVREGSTSNYRLVLTSTEVAVAGSVRFELRMVDGEEILKAAIYIGIVEASLSGIGDTPGEPIPDALNRLETAISEVGKYADLKEKVDALQTSGASTEEVADTNAVSIHGADGVYDLSKGTIQARLNTLEGGEGLKVEKKSVDTLVQVGGATISLSQVNLEPGGSYFFGEPFQIYARTTGELSNSILVIENWNKTNDHSRPPFVLLPAIVWNTGNEVAGYIFALNPTNSYITIARQDITIVAYKRSNLHYVSDVSGNVIHGGAGDVTKSYVDSQDAALDAKITAAINAANAKAGGGTSSTKIANGTGMAQVGPGKELVVDYSATGFTSAPVVVASHCQTGDSDTDTSGIVKVLSVTKTGCKISIIGGTTDHNYPVSWIATGT